MPITPEERARIARENGAKSKGPITEEGKLRSSRNAITHGERAEKLALFVPPHYSCACNEDRQAFYRHLDTLLALYQPVNEIATGIVRDIATANWEIARLNAEVTNLRNLALVEANASPLTLTGELAEAELTARATSSLFAPNSALARLHRQIDRLHLRVARLERRLVFVHNNFPTRIAHPIPTQPIENKEPAAPNEPTAESELPLYVNETSPEILAAYRAQFPGRDIIIVPPDAVSRGEDIPDDLPPVPRHG
jgi:hypothetical protein